MNGDWSVVIVAHGSPEEKGNTNFRETFARLRQMVPAEVDLREGFIEHASPGVQETLTAVSPQAAGIAMVPYLLFDAGHSKSDVPRYISEARRLFPGMTIIREWALGTDQILVEILLSLLPQASSTCREAVVLVGRGSLDANANASLYYQGRRLWERRKGALPRISFIGVTDPRLPLALEELSADMFDRIILVPVFLFEGVLMDRIRRQANEFVARTGFKGEMVVTPAFGDHPLLLSHMVKRILRLVRTGKTPMPRWPVVTPWVEQEKPVRQFDDAPNPPKN